MELTIDLNGWNDLYSTVRDLSNLNGIQTDEEIHINVVYTCGNFVNSDSYILIAATYQELTSKGYSITVSFDIDQSCETVQYASRINFFRNVDIDFQENFRRNSANGRFVEITNIAPGSYSMSEEVLQVFEANFALNENEIESVILAVNELICNMTLHSETSSGGLIFSQKYNSRNHIDFIICDRGVGICETLRRSHPDWDNSTALQNCIEYEVTCGNGRGHGLYIISELVKRNGGTLDIVSGENALRVTSSDVNISNIDRWQGTIVKFSFNLVNPLPIFEIYEELKYNTHG